MGGTKTGFTTLAGKSERKSPFNKHMLKREDNIKKKDLKEMRHENAT
jgi:hypothetical protein